MSDLGGIKINKEQQVTYTPKEDGYVILNRDWKRIKKTISKLKPPSVVWSNVAWGTLGIGVPCVISWLLDSNAYIYLGIGALTIGISVCSFFAYGNDSKRQIESVDQLNEVIKEIEEAIIPKE